MPKKVWGKFFLVLLLATTSSFGGELKPKYGPQATPLSLSWDYFSSKKSAGPDFFALMPYYVGQRDHKSCSVASVVMVVNATRIGRPLSTEDKLLSQDEILERVTSNGWKSKVGPLGRGVKLDELGEILEDALKKYGTKLESVEVVHAEDSAPFRQRLHRALVENEKTNKDFIVANFDQKVFTDDAEVGHISPVGAYDEKRKRVLVLDSDREWYEPYWVSEEVFAQGMITLDRGSGKRRGFVWVKTK